MPTSRRWGFRKTHPLRALAWDALVLLAHVLLLGTLAIEAVVR